MPGSELHRQALAAQMRHLMSDAYGGWCLSGVMSMGRHRRRWKAPACYELNVGKPLRSFDIAVASEMNGQEAMYILDVTNAYVRDSCRCCSSGICIELNVWAKQLC